MGIENQYIEKLFSVKDKIILVTGSSKGLGLSLVKGFAFSGAVVIVNGRNREAVDTVVRELKSRGCQAHGVPFDVTNEEEVKQGIDGIEKKIGPIDALVNNAGIHIRSPLQDMSLADFRKVIEADLTSAFIVAQAAAHWMIKRGRGKIINITSLNAEMARPTIANYCAAKGGLKMLTKAMAAEWGKHNITVNAIGPGYFLTELTEKLARDPDFDSWVKKETPLGRWGKPDELIGAALFLVSDASSYVTGHTIYVDGGWQASL
jgi:gluconate 5-dehydrogenase